MLQGAMASKGGPAGLGMLLGMLQAASAGGGLARKPLARPDEPSASAPARDAASSGGPPPELLKMLREFSRDKEAAARAAAAAASSQQPTAAGGDSSGEKTAGEHDGKPAAVADGARLSALEATVQRLSDQLAELLPQRPAAGQAASLLSGGDADERGGKEAGRSNVTAPTAPPSYGASGPSPLEGRVAALEDTCARLVRGVIPRRALASHMRTLIMSRCKQLLRIRCRKQVYGCVSVESLRDGRAQLVLLRSCYVVAAFHTGDDAQDGGPRAHGEAGAARSCASWAHRR